MSGGLARIGLALGAAFALAGCLVPREPLADLHPVVWAEAGRVSLHTCRWPDGASLGVRVEGGALPEEIADLDRALAAWSGAGLGIGLRRTAEPEASLVVRFLDDPPRRDAGDPGLGSALADCRRTASGRFVLERGSVDLARRLGPDWRGRFRDLAPDERLGALVHELGHALGFAGHARGLGGPLIASPEAIRHLGRDLRAGRPFAAPGLRSLYALPSGTIRASAAVEAWRSEDVDALLRLAGPLGLDGPWLRAGDRSARIFWRTPSGEELGLLAPELDVWRSAPATVLLLPEPGLRAWLRTRADGSGRR